MAGEQRKVESQKSLSVLRVTLDIPESELAYGEWVEDGTRC